MIMKRSIFEKFKKDKDKPIAENPQYEKDQAMNQAAESEDSEKKKGFFAKFGAYCKDHRKQAAIVCVLCVFALTAAGIGSYNAIVGDATQGGDKTVTIVDKDTGEEKVVKADSEEAKEAEENGDVVKETTKSSNAAKATEKKSNSNKKSPATSNSGNKKPASSGSSSGSSGSSGGSHSSGGGSSSSGTKPTQPTKPAHTHSYTIPVYSVRYVDVMVCTGCGYTTTGSMNPHIDADPFDECDGSYSSVKEEKYISGYRCSCGATK